MDRASYFANSIDTSVYLVSGSALHALSRLHVWIGPLVSVFVLSGVQIFNWVSVRAVAQMANAYRRLHGTKLRPAESTLEQIKTLF